MIFEVRSYFRWFDSEPFRIVNILGVDHDVIEENLTNEYHEVIILPNSRFNMSLEEFDMTYPITFT
jgi:hypothetical protein